MTRSLRSSEDLLHATVMERFQELHNDLRRATSEAPQRVTTNDPVICSDASVGAVTQLAWQFESALMPKRHYK